MKYSVNPLCFCSWVLLSVCHSIPVLDDKVKNDAKLLVQTTIIRIQKHTSELKVSPNIIISGLDVIPASPPLDGLRSVDETLDIFHLILSKLPMNNVDQILADLFNIQVIIKALARSINCELPEPRNTSNLQNFLQNNSMFHITIGNVALDRLQKYLHKLFINFHELGKC
ncbi:leptin a [Erpetoichthys calabaricus]|uniref:Leptin n=1 Tax=Erpetoichthys calabaricus TaxID=27687 RepID=A0A8C4SR45_ERPCA|nr:leptin a [Erpetoichthys calabaricus]